MPRPKAGSDDVVADRRMDAVANSSASAPAVSERVGGAAPLSVNRLYRPADLSALSFQTTSEIEPIDGLVGQQRAVEAIGFGTRVRKPGFNLFVIGSSGARMQQAVGGVLRQAAQEMPSPPDWVYVNNFSEPHKPIAIELPPGRALEFRGAMRELVDDLKTALPAVFESEDYQTRREAIDQAFQAKQGEAFSALRDKAAGKSIVILRTPVGFALAPARDGQVVPPDEFSKWPEPQRREVQETIEILEKDLEHIMHQIPQWEKAHRGEIRKLNRDTAMFAVGQSIDEVKAKFPDVPRVIEHLEAVRGDLIDNVAMFVMKGEGEERENPDRRIGGSFERYEVNVLVSRA